jgi:hypothetical protein
MLLHHDIDVIWGVVGEVNEVREAYMKGALYPGIGPQETTERRREDENKRYHDQRSDDCGQ